MIKILSIDGGGIRGIIPAAVIEYIEKHTGQSAASLFDYIAGTSTGGIITTMLTVPGKNGKPLYTAQYVKTAYTQLGASVFKKSLPRSIATLGGLLSPKYSAVPLQKLLRQYLGNAALGSALTKVIIPAYDTKNCKPHFFKSSVSNLLPGKLLSAYNPLMREVARATSAAPSFFRPAEFADKCFIDGGIFANNPALCAYAEALRYHPGSDVLVVSLGTGENNESLSCRQIKNWGAAKWLLPLLGVIMNSASATVNYQMKALTGLPNYFRFQTKLCRKRAAMDDVSQQNIDYLQEVSHALIQQNRHRLDLVCRMLTENSAA